MRRINLPFLLLAVLALLVGLWAGLIRLPWPLPPLRPTLPMAHGPLMVGGFLGTLVSLERAVGLSALGRGRRWTYAAPALAGLGGLLLLAGVPGWPGPLAITLGSAVPLVLLQVSLAAAVYVLLNVGLVLRVIGEPALAVSPAALWGWLLALSALLQWLAGIGFVANTWGRVKER